jgi:acid phosphatase type 7
MKTTFTLAKFFFTSSVIILLAACQEKNLITDSMEEKASAEVTTACSGTDVLPSRLFLQQITDNSAIIKWRGEAVSLCFGQSANRLNTEVTATVGAGRHKEVRLTNLMPDTTYYYSIGGAGQADPKRRFRTAPETGQSPADGNVHIWILGDSGTASSRKPDGTPTYPGQAAAVRDGFLDYNAASGNEPVDLFLMLGDNAYGEGSDIQYQIAVFDTYADLLQQVALWPTVGNHEMGAGQFGDRTFGGVSVSSDPCSYYDLDDDTEDFCMPYLDIFSLPTKGEAGGVPSLTEQYYSFNYGNVHIVSLDSHLSTRNEKQRKTMKQWLIEDLSTNQQDWTLVIFHHPPYSKGTHDSDSTAPHVADNGIDFPMPVMRQEFTPVFEQYGVDLVFTGHSHAYERSYYIHNHTGDSGTFDPEIHSELNGRGLPATGNNGEEYSKITRSGKDDKVVYIVAGNGGSAVQGRHGLNYPAKVPLGGKRGLTVTGSMVVDATSTELKTRFVDDKGQVLDSFSIRK